MAKQTFTTGQVLTAAQMTSLQQTAMLGGAASAKTASYTLVAADAGTAISMDSASATTITVNTALFAAGDTVQITNLGAGVCTITAGTATVNTSASLALAQYESGTLNFTSTSAAIFIKGAGGAAASGALTSLESGSLTGASVTTASLSGSYKYLYVVIKDLLPATDATALRLRFNSDTNARYNFNNSVGSSSVFDETSIAVTATSIDNSTSDGLIVFTVPEYSNTTTWKYADIVAIHNDSTSPTTTVVYTRRYGFYNQTSAITTLTFFMSSGNFTSGTYIVYGVN